MIWSKFFVLQLKNLILNQLYIVCVLCVIQLIDRPKVEPLVKEERPDTPETEFTVSLTSVEQTQPEEMGDLVVEEVTEQAVTKQEIDRPKVKPLVQQVRPDSPDLEQPTPVTYELTEPEQPQQDAVTEEFVVSQTITKKFDIPGKCLYHLV